MSTEYAELAREFARTISSSFQSPPYYEILCEAEPLYEHKKCGPLIHEELSRLLEDRAEGLVAPRAETTWEGKERGTKTKPPRYSYHVLGTNSYPDAAVLSPFRCAFEFDREPKPRGTKKPTSGVSRLKTALMKTAVHVLSSAYDAAALVYVRHPQQAGIDYRNDTGEYTSALLRTLEEKGVYLAVVDADGRSTTALQEPARNP